MTATVKTRTENRGEDQSRITPQGISDFIRSNCIGEKNTRAFLKRIGLTYGKNGKPVVRPV